MAYRDNLSCRGAFAHNPWMLASLVLLAGCSSGDLTQNSDLPDSELVGVDATAAGRGGDDRKKEGQNRLEGVSLSPTSVTLEPGATQRFTATVKLREGGTSTTWPVKWSATGGTIDHGLYTARTLGVHRVIATSWYGTFADTAVVTVSGTAGTLVSLSVTPGSATLATGGTQRFAVSGKLSDGTTTVPSVTWTVTGGTITSDQIYTAGSTGGTYRAVATHESKVADTATITIAATGPAPTDPPTSAAGCPSSGYRRVVNVANAYALANALSAAQPGDQIQLASGTYSGTINVTGKIGTVTDSITLCGPSTAIISGSFNITDARYWRFQGFQIKNGWIGIYAKNLDNSRISGLEVSNVGQEGIMLWNGSNNNVLSKNWIHDTGKTAPQYGEGFYIGQGQSGATAAQRAADFNQMLNNKIGPNVTAEHFDVKLGTQGNIVKGNKHDGTGFNVIWSNGDVTAALVIMDGSNQRLEADSVTNLLDSDPNNWAVFRTYAGTGTIVTKNVVIGPTTAKRLYDKDHASGTIVKCDNVKPSTMPWGTTCTN
jgi:parallel beta-helix repeat protein